MSKFESQPNSEPIPVVVQEIADGMYHARREGAMAETDPFVHVQAHNLLHARPKDTETIVQTHGVFQYREDEEPGFTSLYRVGRASKIVVEAGQLSPEETANLAKKIASLAFELSDGSDGKR